MRTQLKTTASRLLLPILAVVAVTGQPPSGPYPIVVGVDSAHGAFSGKLGFIDENGKIVIPRSS